MPSIIRFTLTTDQRAELQKMLNYADKPYLRERAAALLKIGDGQTITQVAAHGLLRPRQHETVRGWLRRYQQAGLAGLTIQTGRGRKAAFFPSD